MKRTSLVLPEDLLREVVQISGEKTLSGAVVVEHGAGVKYRALCIQDMAKGYSALAKGDATAIANEPQLASGSVAGQGSHTTDFRVDDCKFYLIVSALKPADTVVSLRIRA